MEPGLAGQEGSVQNTLDCVLKQVVDDDYVLGGYVGGAKGTCGEGKQMIRFGWHLKRKIF